MGLLEWLFGPGTASPRLVMEWEGVAFRERDRVVSRNSGETTIKPDETGHRVEVLLGDGKTGSVVRVCNASRNWIYVEWDAQRWQEAGKRRGGKDVGKWVRLAAFQCCLHVDYIYLAGGVDT